MENPFKFGSVVHGPYFADREKELEELTRAMEGLERIFLVSPRRYGKTCVLFNLTERLKGKGLAVAFVDLNAYPDLSGLAAGMSHRLAQALESDLDKLLKVFSSMRRLRPRLAVGPDGEISAGLEPVVERKEAVEALLEGLARAGELAARKKKRLAVMIDEFSDIQKYDGEAVEKALRSEIQRQDHLGFIFCGSETSVMLAMVNDRRRAFYKMARVMALGPIPREAYVEFIHSWLERGGIEASREDLIRILELGADVPYNVQRLCHNLWEIAIARDRKATRELIEELPEAIARQDSPHYELLWRGVTPSQRLLLMALASAPQAQPFSRDFQLRHGIGPSSSIKASLDSLVRKGILFQERSGIYRFTDIFFPRWMECMSRAPGKIEHTP